MATLDLAATLDGFSPRAAGSDAERRAARRLADELTLSGHEVRIEPFWCRPNWALAQCWHVGLGLAGSLLAVASPTVGGALLLVALVSVIADALLGVSPGRRLTPERASQNVVATTRPTALAPAKPMRLIITANYDAGRVGVVYADRPRAAAAWLARRTGGLSPGWLGWLAIALVWLLVVAVFRAEGSKGTTIGAVQLPPTVLLVIALAGLLELASATISPGAGDNGSGAAVAVSVARALAVSPPAHAEVELVLQGAGDAGAIGLRRYLRVRRRERVAANTVVLGLAACGRGRPAWWVSDGPLLPVRASSPLCGLCERIAAEEPHLGAAPHRGRGSSPTLPAYLARLPAITIGCVDERGLAPGSHRPTDTLDRLSVESLDAIVQFGLMLVDAVDGHLARTRPPRLETASPPPATAAESS